MADLTADTVSVNQTIKKLQGKVVVVTGGASGIGEVTARKFVLHGALAMVIADIQDELGQTVVKSLGPGRSTYIHCDVTDEDQQTVLELDLSNYDKVMAVNARGMAACVKHAAKAMVEGGVRGSIVCMASAAAGQGGPMFTDYTMSKDAVMGLMRNQVEVVRQVCEKFASLKGVVLTARHAAEAALFLACEDSELVTGHDMMVDGGFIFCMIMHFLDSPLVQVHRRV
ncbi:unnamed protein product [Malus baccata var. baccata]